MHTRMIGRFIGLCLLCPKICPLYFLAFPKFFTNYVHFYVSNIELCLQFLHIMVKTDQEKPLSFNASAKLNHLAPP